jgi:hypothetical protein
MPAVQGSAPQMNNNPSDYNSSNIYTLGFGACLQHYYGLGLDHALLRVY